MTSPRINRKLRVALGITGALLTASFVAGGRSFVAGLPRPSLRLAVDGQSTYSIVEGNDPTAAERLAATELAAFLEQVTNATLPKVPEDSFGGGNGIYVGRTRFAVHNGVDLDALGEEEWDTRVVGSDLIIAGGRPRGVLYGVYEFLERQAGVRFLAADTTHVPTTPALAVPADLSARATPVFRVRDLYTFVNGTGPEDQTRFQVRRKVNSFANSWRRVGSQYGFSVVYGSPYSTHVHNRYVADFPEAFENHPEYFALTRRGKRAFPKGQVCMSRPEVREIFAEKLREYIKRDRARIRQAGTGEPFPHLYSLTPDDGTSGKCFCARCKAKAERHESYAGVVLEFVNAIADDLARDHPEITLRADAYLYFRDVPKGIRPRADVMLNIAQLGARYNTHPKRDRTRSLTHPLNREPLAEWTRWSEISDVMGVHDYWSHANVRAIAENITLYHRFGVRYLVTENLLLGSRVHNLADLGFYVASRLLVDPTLDGEALIYEFMDLYYGPAAPVMERFLAYLDRRREEEPGYTGMIPERARRYYDAAYFIDTDAILREAEARVEGDTKRRANIRLEHLPLDRTMLHLWNTLAKEAGERWPFDRQQVFERLEENYRYAYKKDGGWGKRRRQQDDIELEYLRNMPPIPRQFEGREIIDLCGPKLRLTRGGRAPQRAVDDADAATGKAWRIDAAVAAHSTREGRVRDHSSPPQFGLSDCVSTPKFLVKTVLTPDQIPRDEQYHWHFVGRMQATPTMYFRAHRSWVFDQRLMDAYNAALPDQDFYDVYVSVKLEGPAYVPDSRRESAFSIDRIILVKVAPEELEDGGQEPGVGPTSGRE